MAKAFKDKRVVFHSGKQREFLEQVGKKLSVADMARISNCSERTIREWRRDKFSIPLTAVHALSARTNISIPKNIRIRDAYEHIAKASRMGLAEVIKKYGGIPRDERYRKEQWHLWWKTTGKFKTNSILASKDIYRPKRDVKLAEFVGIMMGDGGTSEYQIVITLHHIDDLEYSIFVAKLIKKLSFSSASEPLRQSVHTLLQKLGLHPRIAGSNVRLDRTEDMKRYFLIIGSHNPKHLRRYENTVG